MLVDPSIDHCLVTKASCGLDSGAANHGRAYSDLISGTDFGYGIPELMPDWVEMALTVVQQASGEGGLSERWSGRLLLGTGGAVNALSTVAGR